MKYILNLLVFMVSGGGDLFLDCRNDSTADKLRPAETGPASMAEIFAPDVSTPAFESITAIAFRTVFLFLGLLRWLDLVLGLALDALTCPAPSLAIAADPSGDAVA